ncbi:response regulator [Massilia sp. DD77]|uniref:response regulator n=1 Tax=Massilia sp. DD77 TaxID=3109349 RepID=UPI002FFD8ABB
MFRTPVRRRFSTDDHQFPPPGMAARPDAFDSEPGAQVHKVLVVDDQRDLADLAEALLRSHGLEVVVAYSADEALRALEAHPDIDAVFSDVMMPGMNGLDLADHIDVSYPHIKVVLTSGFTIPELLAERRKRYLFAPKPYNIATILRLLRS